MPAFLHKWLPRHYESTYPSASKYAVKNKNNHRKFAAISRFFHRTTFSLWRAGWATAHGEKLFA